MTRARFVYFDLGNVLVKFDHQIAIERLSQRCERSPTRIQEVLFASGLQNRYEMGLIGSDEFAEQINQDLQTALSAAEIHEALSAIFTPNDAILAALQVVRDAGVPMAVLSNTCETHWKWIAAQRWPMLSGWFDFHVLSYEVHSMKPESKIYEVSERRAGCRGGSIFFTDDRAENVAAAEQRGWMTCQFRSVAGLLDALQGWLTE